MNNTEIKKEIVSFGYLLEQKGLLNALEGNISVIDRQDGDKLYISPSAKSKMLLREEMIPVLNDRDEQIDGTLKRSSEYLLHRAVFRARPDTNACIHTHAPYLSAYAFCGMDIEIGCTSSFYLGYAGKIPCLPYGEPGTSEIFDGIGNLIRDNNLILLGNHGAICVGKTMEECLRIVDGAEAVIRSYLLARQVGTPLNLSQEKVESLMANHPFSKYYKGNK